MASARSIAGTTAWLAAALALLNSGCGSGGKSEPQPPTRAEVFEAVAASAPQDSDLDGLPDDVEDRFRAVLGTDKTKADSDGDGLNDAMELFGASWVYLQTQGQAGVRPAEQAAGYVAEQTLPHEADQVDSDGDGVPDLLEVAGFRYAWERGRFVLDPAGYHTDPLQWSTDQDAYSDGMEASGLNMDVAVRAPGDHPLVPAYPDISVELTGYSVTLSQTVTYGSGSEIEAGTSWSREVESTHSFELGTELTTTIGAEVGVDLSFSFELSASVSTNTTDTVGYKSMTGGSQSEKMIWNQARTVTPTDAARLKLFAKVRNRGTAPASNVVPTISLRIGGADVATFEPPGLSVAMLAPGGVFPPEDGVNWVMDQTGEARPLSLTDWELRGLELGAPVSMSIAQKRADVMRLDPVDGWERVGDAGDYLTRILAVSADLSADVGIVDGLQGNLLHARVAANDTPTSPEVRIGDALAWSMGFKLGDDGVYSVELPLETGGTETVRLVGSGLDDRDWRWQIDPLTLSRNYLVTPADLSLAEVLALRLVPGSRIALRAPRQLEESGPLIHSAYAARTDAGYQVTTCASDYDGLARVTVVDALGEEIMELAHDGRGPWFFSGKLPRAPQGGDQILAQSRRLGQVRDPRDPAGPTIQGPLWTSAPIAIVYAPEPQAPVFKGVTYAPAAGIITYDRLYASVLPGGPLQADDVTWVRIYHDAYTRAGGADADGYVELVRVPNAFEDASGWEKRTLPGGWRSRMRLVAYSTGGRYTILPLDAADDFKAYQSGLVTLDAMYDYTWDDEFWIPQVDMERAPPPPVLTAYTGDSDTWFGDQWLADVWKIQVAGSVAGWTPAHGMADLYLRDSQWACTLFYMGFQVAARKAPGTGDAYYQSLSKASVAALASTFYPGYFRSRAGEAAFEYAVGDVFLFETADTDAAGGATRLGKLIVRNTSGWGPTSGNRCGGQVQFDYMVFTRAGDP